MDFTIRSAFCREVVHADPQQSHIVVQALICAIISTFFAIKTRSNQQYQHQTTQTANAKGQEFWCYNFRIQHIYTKISQITQILIPFGVKGNGLSLKADTHSGKLVFSFFNTDVDLSSSSVSLSGDFFIESIGRFVNFLRKPLNILFNSFFEPFLNHLINDVIISGFFTNGLYTYEVLDYSDDHFDNLIVDFTLPQNPTFTSGMIDVFTTAGVYLEKQGQRIPAPTAPMSFQVEDQNLQAVISSSTANQIIDVYMSIEYCQWVIGYEFGQALESLQLTTTSLQTAIPQLLSNYGARDVSLEILPLTGTYIEWVANTLSTKIYARAFTKWTIESDDSGHQEEVAFEATLDLDGTLSLDIDATTYLVTVTLSNLNLSGFSVTQDNLGGSIQSDEAGILSRLDSEMPAVESAINNYIASNYDTNLYIPDSLQLTIKLDYQDNAFGVGVMVEPK